MRENLLFHGRFFGMKAKEPRLEADCLVEQFRLHDRADAPVLALSGGMAQRLMVGVLDHARGRGPGQRDSLPGIQAVALPLVQEFGYTKEIEDRVLAPLPVQLVAIEKIVSGALQCLVAAAIVFPIACLVPATPVQISYDWPVLLTFIPLACVAASSLGLMFGTFFERPGGLHQRRPHVAMGRLPGLARVHRAVHVARDERLHEAGAGLTWPPGGGGDRPQLMGVVEP